MTMTVMGGFSGLQIPTLTVSESIVVTEAVTDTD